MKLLIMLAAIYALIINQALKQKERKNATIRVNTTNKNSDIKPDNNIYFNAVSKPVITSLPVKGRGVSSINKDLSPALYKQQPFRAMNDFSRSTQQELFYPLNYSYTPVTKKDGSR